MNNPVTRYLVLPSLLLMASCTGSQTKDPAVSASHSGAATRAHWQAIGKQIKDGLEPAGSSAR